MHTVISFFNFTHHINSEISFQIKHLTHKHKQNRYVSVHHHTNVQKKTALQDWNISREENKYRKANTPNLFSKHFQLSKKKTCILESNETIHRLLYCDINRSM